MAKNGTALTTLVEMAAEIGADRYIKSQEENTKLREEIAGLMADRESLVAICISQRQTLHEMTRTAAQACYSRLPGRYQAALESIRDRGDKALRR